MDRRDQPEAFTLRYINGTGPFSIWDPYLDAVWPPLLGSTALAALRSIEMAIIEKGEGTDVPVDLLASLAGIAPQRFIDALTRASHKSLIHIDQDQLHLPHRFHGPNTLQVSALPDISIAVAERRLLRFAEGAPGFAPRTSGSE